MGKKPRRSPRRTAGLPGNITVRVLANEVGDDVIFTHTWQDNNAAGQWHDPPIMLPRRTGPWTLNYQLFDFTSKRLEFQEKADDTMWVRQGPYCPSRKGNGAHILFGSVGKGPSGKRTLMTIEDDNAGAAINLRYMLCFDPDPITYKYDPDIKNGGTT